MVTVLVEAISLVWGPAKDATVPNLVPRHRLEAANQVSLATTYGSALPAAALFAAADRCWTRSTGLIGWSSAAAPSTWRSTSTRCPSSSPGSSSRGSRASRAGPPRARSEGSAWSVVIGSGWGYVGRTPAGPRPGDRHRRCLRRRRRGGRPGPHLRLGPRRRRLRLRRAVRRRVRRPGAGMWRGPRAAAGALAAPAVRDVADRDRAAAVPARAGRSSCRCGRRWPSVLGFFAGAAWVTGQHHAGPGGARRGPRPHLRLRRLDDPAGARAGAGRRAAAGRTDRRPRLRARWTRSGEPLAGLQRRRLHVPARRRC